MIFFLLFMFVILTLSCLRTIRGIVEGKDLVVPLARRPRVLIINGVVLMWVLALIVIDFTS